MADSKSWEKIFKDYNIINHDFDSRPFPLSSEQIKKSCQKFKKTAQKEVRILCKQDSRADRPDIFIDNDLFLLPVKNGSYVIIKGEGYVDIPNINTKEKKYESKLDFRLESSEVGNSEMQHLDFAYASSLIRTFMNDESLVLTIRGRKYTPEFSFMVGNQLIETKSVQTEVDAGFEGKDKIVLIEAKNSKTTDTIIRQLFYPYRKWKIETKKEVFLLFFENRDGVFYIWQYGFTNENDYNSIKLIKSGKYLIKGPNT
ncbi:Mu-like prophage protein gp29 [uncultured Gammaproteobacteria bacterium]|nr:Mu-like prophage protein gp29 [uncultured Gammaproteobacteria bacterium]CAC9613023.1 Mu-like prophage protein gp29 [uncultured Gammaproteobacteria bacterium]